MVASLPEHAHLFPELGCLGEKDEQGAWTRQKCAQEHMETPLDESMHPLALTPEMDEAWDAWIAKRVEK